jgi:hypothetical protein
MPFFAAGCALLLALAASALLGDIDVEQRQERDVKSRHLTGW